MNRTKPVFSTLLQTRVQIRPTEFWQRSAQVSAVIRRCAASRIPLFLSFWNGPNKLKTCYCQLSIEQTTGSSPLRRGLLALLTALWLALWIETFPLQVGWQLPLPLMSVFPRQRQEECQILTETRRAPPDLLARHRGAFRRNHPLLNVLSFYLHSIFSFSSLPSEDVQIYLWILLLTVRFLDVAKFNTLTPLSLLIACKVSFQIVALEISSQPTLALKSPNRIFMWYLGKILNTRSSSS
jgi:hypothetical protein